MTINEALDEFILTCKANGLRQASIKWYASMIKPLLEVWKDRDIATITPHDLRTYIASQRDRDTRYIDGFQKPVQEGGLSDSSIAGHIRALHRFFSWWADETGALNPMRSIKRVKVPKPKPKAINPKDFVKLFNATLQNKGGIRDKAILAFLADTGARLGGLLSVTLDNLDMQRRRAIVKEKGGKERTVYFTAYTSQLIYEWIKHHPSTSSALFVNLDTGAPLTASGVHEMLKRLKKRAKVTGRVNPHSFRHNFAREYIRNGGEVVTLAKILGHSDINVTSSYYAVFDEDELAEFHAQHTPMKDLLNDLSE